MFSKSTNPVVGRSHVSIFGTDAFLVRRIKAAIEVGGRYRAEIGAGPGMPSDAGPAASRLAEVQFYQVSTDQPSELSALARHMQSQPAGMPVIVISNGLAENEARQFLKLGIADWLPSSCSDDDLRLACDQALEPRKDVTAAPQARCIAFMSAIGGAGATTLGLAAAVGLAGKDREALRRTCVIDLDLQHSTLADYADVVPALHLDEIGDRPERLDRHLLEIMLTRHPSGLCVLAATPGLDAAYKVRSETVGRVLDLAASDFDQLVLDLPTCWQPWCEDIVRGLDALYIVTDTTVTGLRQARRLAEMVNRQCSLDMSSSVIANKARYFGANVSRGQAREALGGLLAGFVPDVGDRVTRSQDQGATLASLGPRSRITRNVVALLAHHKTARLATTATEGRIRP